MKDLIIRMLKTKPADAADADAVLAVCDALAYGFNTARSFPPKAWLYRLAWRMDL
ncbi:MAG: hypothetical protein HUJ63_00185 [Enterococcus sp.]|nr:hypothetical protein [Enterococcus sp.]